MAFTLQLYNTKDDPRKLHKDYVEVGTANVRPTDTLDVINPVFELDYKESLLGANYAYCPLFNRFYFINDIKVDIGKKIILSCAVDVLMSYGEQISAMTVNVMRQENMKESYLADPQYKILSGFQNYNKIFVHGPGQKTFDGPGGMYVISLMGGQAPEYWPVQSEPPDWDENWATYYVYIAEDDEYTYILGPYAYKPDFQTVVNEYGGVYARY